MTLRLSRSAAAASTLSARPAAADATNRSAEAATRSAAARSAPPPRGGPASTAARSAPPTRRGAASTFGGAVAGTAKCSAGTVGGGPAWDLSPTTASGTLGAIGAVAFSPLTGAGDGAGKGLPDSAGATGGSASPSWSSTVAERASGDDFGLSRRRFRAQGASAAGVSSTSLCTSSPAGVCTVSAVVLGSGRHGFPTGSPVA